MRSAPVLRVAACLGVFIAFLPGGCPTAQQPRTPPSEQEQSTEPRRNEENTPTRPIPTVEVDPPSQNTSSSSGGGGSTGGNSGGAGGGDAFSFSMLDPTAIVGVRPGPALTLRYSVSDPRGVARKVQLVLAADDDADGKADGPPLFARDVNLTGGTSFVLDTGAADLAAQLVNGFRRFKVGLQVEKLDGSMQTTFAGGGLLVDAVPASGQWIEPGDDVMLNPETLPIRFVTADNSPHSYRVLLDPDGDPANGNETEIVPSAAMPAAGTVSLTPDLTTVPPGDYRVYLYVTDSIEPGFGVYAARAAGGPVRVVVTRRLIGEFDLETLVDSAQGAILEGFNFNDLAGSSISKVPDVDGDGTDELILGARFGKAQIITNSGVGFGEAYLLYGATQRLHGQIALNRIGHDVPGLIFTGMRTPRSADIAPPNESARWTEGLSDIAVIPDMDGDDLPELVFSFPRCESVSLRQTNPSIQHPDMFPDLPGMGELEYDAFDGTSWVPGTAQFTRGGVVIVSSHDYMVIEPDRLSRKSNRVIDLAEVGQLFPAMSRARPFPYIKQALLRGSLEPARRGPSFVCADCDGEPPEDCDPNVPQCGNDDCALNGGSLFDGRETQIPRYVVQWDMAFADQAPGGFFTPWTPLPADPPLANPARWPFGNFPFNFYPNHWVASGDACQNACEVTNEWYVWPPGACAFAGASSWSSGGSAIQDPLPDCYPDNPCITDPPCVLPDQPCQDPQVTVNSGDFVIWTGFYPECNQMYVSTNTGEVFPSPIGARILGQKVNDHFGAQVSADGTWLYISAPQRTANDAPYGDDVPALPGARNRSGVVYQLRTHAALTPDGITRTQLWMEPQPGLRPAPACAPAGTAVIPPWWPYVDAELGFRADFTMPMPHQYIIESIGSIRGTGGSPAGTFGDPATDGCPPGYSPSATGRAFDVCSTIYPVGTAGYYMDRTPQIVGPHADAQIEYVRALGDLNGDGVRDFAVGSANIRQNVLDGTGPAVGGVFLVFGRPSGLEGDYLLEQLALNVGDPGRLRGVLLKGAGAGDTLARVVADAGDVNRDGFGDVLIGNESADGGRGEAILIYGSDDLLSPGANDPGGAVGGGWTPATIPASRIVRIRGANPGDLAGANVSSAGDIDGDGFSDLLVSAPGAAGGRGEVALIYGGGALPGTIELGGLTPRSIATPYVRFTGRHAGDFLGAGAKTIAGTDPAGGSTLVNSQGLATIGDIDDDGVADFVISSMLADPGGRVDAGEIYVLYGRRGQ